MLAKSTTIPESGFHPGLAQGSEALPPAIYCVAHLSSFWLDTCPVSTTARLPGSCPGVCVCECGVCRVGAGGGRESSASLVIATSQLKALS